MGQTQHWVAEIIERRIIDPAQLPTEMAALPAGPGEWHAWLSESAQRVASACSDDALGAPVFNAAGDERSGTRFWMSTVLNEAVVHGFDAADAAGRPADIDADIAAALISNHFTMLTSPTWQMQRPVSAHAIRGTGQTLQWLATGTAGDAGAWFVERRPDGAAWQPGTRQADVTVTGPAIAAADLDPTTPAHRRRSHRHQRRRRHRPRPALARQHRPCQRLTGAILALGHEQAGEEAAAGQLRRAARCRVAGSRAGHDGHRVGGAGRRARARGGGVAGHLLETIVRLKLRHESGELDDAQFRAGTSGFAQDV